MIDCENDATLFLNIKNGKKKKKKHMDILESIYWLLFALIPGTSQL